MRNLKVHQARTLIGNAARIIAFGALLLLLSCPLSAQDSATVKIRVDVDNVLLTINGDSVAVDSHGSRLTKEAWFILKLSVGDYELVIDHSEYETQNRNVTLVAGEIVSLEIAFLPPVEPIQPATGVIVVESEPDSAAISIDGKAIGEVTPAQLDLAAGQRVVELTVADMEPLSKTVTVDSLHRTIMKYRLRPMPPLELTADSLGLLYDVQLPNLDERKAVLLKQQFNALAETFAIIPLGQGILAKVLLDSEDQGTANALVISGIVLTVGSYILGRTLSARKLRNIKLENEEIDSYNARAVAHNFDVDQAVHEANQKALKKYQTENRGRGRVQVTKE